MLNQNDIKLLGQLFKQSEENILHQVDNRITASEDKMLHTIDERITAYENKIFKTMDERFTASENMVLKELDRVQEHLENDIQKVQSNLDEIQQYYRITKLENDNYSLLLQMYNTLQQDIAETKLK